MANYVREDYDNAIPMLEKIEGISGNISTLNQLISNYSVDILIKLEGDVADTISKQLKEHYDELNKLYNRAKIIYSLKSDNAAVSSSFGKDYELDSDYIDEIKKQLDKLKEYQATAKRMVNSLGYDDLETRSYWQWNLTQYNNLISQLESVYERLRKELIAVRNADTSTTDV